MDTYAGMDTAINSTYDLTFDLQCIFEDDTYTILKSDPVHLLRRELIRRLEDQNVGDKGDQRSRFDIIATVFQDIDLSACNGRTDSLLRTPISIIRALRVAKKTPCRTIFVLVSTHHLFLLDDHSAPFCFINST